MELTNTAIPTEIDIRPATATTSPTRSTAEPSTRVSRIKAGRLLPLSLPAEGSSARHINYIPAEGGKEITLPASAEVYRRFFNDKPNLIINKSWILVLTNGVVTDFYSEEKTSSMPGFQVDNSENTKTASQAMHVILRRSASGEQVSVDTAPPSVSSALQNELIQSLRAHPRVRKGEYLMERYKVLQVIQETDYDLIEVDPQRR